MTVQECYLAMGGDYENVVGRLLTEERIQRFLVKILKDKSYELLCQSMESRDMKEAFRAAHTMKGICQNLAITKLAESSSVLADVLRDRTEYGEDIEPAFERVKEDYEQTVACVRQLAE